MAPKRAAATTASTSSVPTTNEDEDPTSLNPDGMSSSKTTHSREKLKLCEEIILNHFGPIANSITCILLQRGRVSLKDLERFSNKTYTTGQILHTLLILIQHNILFHIRLDQAGNLIQDIGESGGTEYFEINPEAILVRSRFGIYIEQAERSWGNQGRDIIRLILENGKLQVSDLLYHMPSTSSSTRPLITHLLLSAYILPSTTLSHISPDDLRIAYINQERKLFKGIPGPKDVKQFEETVKDRIATERRETRGTGYRLRDQRDVGQARSSTTSSGKKSKSSTSAGKPRKRKMAIDDDDDQQSEQVNGSTSNEDTEWMTKLSDFEREKLDEVIVTDNTYVKINYDRFDVHIRNEEIFNLISSTLNSTAAMLYMKMVESAQARKMEDGSWPSVSDRSSDLVSLTILASALSKSNQGKDLQLNKGFDKSMFTRLSNKKNSKPVVYDFVAEYVALLSRAEDITARGSQNYGSGGETAAMTSSLRFLTPGTTNTDVTTFTGSKISSSCAIDFVSLGRKMKWNLLKQTIEKVFGETESKVLGVLRKEGKLEEKHISKLSLLSLSETREACERLFSYSILNLQEIPKTSDRNPQRTFFLYYLDYPKSLAWLQDHIFKTQARIMQKRSNERDKFKLLLNKIERSDVISDGIENVLSKVEIQRLNDCKERLQLLTVAELRVERQSWILARMPS
ncbi:unnamed protein product [Sympodiomycopsis kandeliae]